MIIAAATEAIEWKASSFVLSPRYTTRYSDLLVVR
ncbi:DUF4113 domain-containing protein [Enterobacter bugandensis]